MLQECGPLRFPLHARHLDRRPAASLAWPSLTAAGIAWFVLAAAALHVLRPDVDAIDSQMSLYLVGAWGPLLQSAYAALGVAMIGLAVGLYRSMPPSARSAAPGLLFVLAGISLTVTAYAWMDMPGIGASLEGLVHGISAQGAFLFATGAIVLQALRFRLDPAWRRHIHWLLPWASPASPRSGCWRCGATRRAGWHRRR